MTEHPMVVEAERQKELEKKNDIDLDIMNCEVSPEEQAEFHKKIAKQNKEREQKEKKKDKINPVVVVGDKLIERYHIKTSLLSDKTYLYMGGYYNSINSEKYLRTSAKPLLGNNYSNYNIRDIISYVKDSTYVNLPEDYTANYICLKNGILSLKTFELEKPTPQSFITHKINVGWNPNADTSEWEDYIDSLVNDTRYAQTIQEFAGYTFEKFQVGKKTIYIYGLRNSGKSTLFSILQSFYNEMNCSQLTLRQLCQKFLNAEIHGKLANIRSDIDYDLAPRSVNLIKSLTGDDIITVQRKFKEPFSFRNKAKIWLSGNGIPALPEKGIDDAFYDRWIPIETPNIFEGKSTSIRDKFTMPEEQSVILKWAIEGLKRLKKNNWQFTYSPSVEKVRNWFAGGIIFNSVEDYLTDRYIPVLDHHELKSDMYEDYVSYCEMRNFPILEEDTFHRKVKNNRIYAVQDYRPTVDGRQERAWKGIKLVG